MKCFITCVPCLTVKNAFNSHLFTWLKKIYTTFNYVGIILLVHTAYIQPEN